MPTADAARVPGILLASSTDDRYITSAKRWIHIALADIRQGNL